MQKHADVTLTSFWFFFLLFIFYLSWQEMLKKTHVHWYVCECVYILTFIDILKTSTHCTRNKCQIYWIYWIARLYSECQSAVHKPVDTFLTNRSRVLDLISLDLCHNFICCHIYLENILTQQSIGWKKNILNCLTDFWSSVSNSVVSVVLDVYITSNKHTVVGYSRATKS